MLTTPAATVNGALPGVMLRVADIARRDRVSAPAVSKTVKRLVEQHGLTVDRDGMGRVVAVNVAEYDDLRGKYSDPTHAQAPQLPAPAGSGTTIDEARRRQLIYDGERSRLKLAQEIGELVPRADVEFAMERASERIAHAIDQMVGSVDELAAGYDAGGIQGLRVRLKDLVHATRSTIAGVLDEMADAAPETDQPVTPDVPA